MVNVAGKNTTDYKFVDEWKKYRKISEKIGDL